MDTQNEGLEKVAPFKYGHVWYLYSYIIYIYILNFWILGGTLPGTNSKFAPVNRPFQRPQGFPSIHFQVLALFLGLIDLQKRIGFFGFGWTKKTWGGLHHASHYEQQNERILRMLSHFTALVHDFLLK